MYTTTVPDGYIRINIHTVYDRSKNQSYLSPNWPKKILGTLMVAMCADYKCGVQEAHDYIIKSDAGIEQLPNLLKTYLGIENTLPYDFDVMKSKGILLKLDDPIVVEYILKYGE